VRVMTDFVCSWSGGKDACLALYRMMQQGHQPKYLLTMMQADGKTTRAHALAVNILQEQANSLGISLITQAAENYKKSYVSALEKLKTKGITDAVFGDIDLQAHRDWQEEIAELTGYEMHFPLWEESHETLVHEFIDAGFKSVIIAVQQKSLGRKFLGKVLNAETLGLLEEEGVDICGEGGEFHTLVVDGPIFSAKVEINPTGDTFSDFGYDFLRL